MDGSAEIAEYVWMTHGIDLKITFCLTKQEKDDSFRFPHVTVLQIHSSNSITDKVYNLPIPTQASITYMAAKEVWKQEMQPSFPFWQHNLFLSVLKGKMDRKEKIKILSHRPSHTKWERWSLCSQAHGKWFYFSNKKNQNKTKTYFRHGFPYSDLFILSSNGKDDVVLLVHSIEASKDAANWCPLACELSLWLELEGWYFAVSCTEVFFCFHHGEKKWSEIPIGCKNASDINWKYMSRNNQKAQQHW